MKQILVLSLLSLSLLACKKEVPTPTATQTETETVAEDLRTLRGEFIYIADAAVLKGNDFIYGVTLDEKTTELANLVAVKKKDEFDMVPVIIKGTVNPKPEGTEGWDNIVTIKEIIQVLEPTGDAPIRVQSEK